MLRGFSGSREAAVGLVVANLVPLVGVLFYGWNAHSILVVYWLESGVVGVESVLKILRAAGEDDPEELPHMQLNERSVRGFVGRSNRKIAGFFVSHYGGFWLAHGVFVLIFPAAVEMPRASLRVIPLALVGLAVYHALSFRLNYVDGREFERTGPVTQMIEPYKRVFVLHLTVVLGFFAIGAVGASVSALAVMVLTKTVLDFWGHWREHERASDREPGPTVPA